MTGPPDFLLVARTVRHLRPQQGVHRIRLRAQRGMIRRWPRLARRVFDGPDPATSAGWPALFHPVDARTPGRWPGLPELAAGNIRLLGTARDLGEPFDWEHADAPQLWRFHLHYWDWAWGVAAAPDPTAARAVFSRLWRSWQLCVTFGHGDAWRPYPAALRAWSWCGLHGRLVTGADFEPAFVTDLAAHAGFLRRHLESDVGGNHLIKGLKALAGLAVFFADERLMHQTLQRLQRQLAVQVLPDGGHYERAPAYHCQVLADLIDIAGLLRAAGVPSVAGLTTAITRMRHWLGAVLCPDQQVPVLNDGYPVPTELLSLLQPAPAPAGPLLVLPDTGLVRATAGGWHLLADVGPPCPPELPAHSHADTFGCLVYVDGKPLLIDTGTSTYEPGPVRDYERSTAAHNTAELDGCDSTEVWGAFRAGRRARVSHLTACANASTVTCAASHDGFRALRGRPRHHRRWSLDGTGLWVDDVITGRGRHTVVIRWHLALGSQVRVTPDAGPGAASPSGDAFVSGPAGDFAVAVAADHPVMLATEQAPAAVGFGTTCQVPVLTCRSETDLPVRVTTCWWRADRGATAEAVT